MARTENFTHNHTSVRDLVKRLRAVADDLEEKADELKAAAGNDYVQVGHHKAVEDGMKSVKAMCIDIAAKINKGVFIKLGKKARSGSPQESS